MLVLHPLQLLTSVIQDVPRRLFDSRAPIVRQDEIGALAGAFNFMMVGLEERFGVEISAETIGDNIRDGWEWDRSMYCVNFYHHPYHGYLYYGAGRANGLGFWGSSLAAVGGRRALVVLDSGGLALPCAVSAGVGSITVLLRHLYERKGLRGGVVKTVSTTRMIGFHISEP